MILSTGVLRQSRVTAMAAQRQILAITMENKNIGPQREARTQKRK